MNYAYKYQNCFDDPLAEEFREILSLSSEFKATDISGCSLWLDASDTSTKNIVNGKVLNWVDKTTGKSFFVANTDNAPIPGALMNGLETLDFLDATSFMRYSGNITYREAFIACKLKQNNRLGQIIGSYSQGIHLAVDMRSNEGFFGTFSFDGNGIAGAQARFSLNGDNYTANEYGNTGGSDVGDVTLGIDIPQSIAVIWKNNTTTTDHYIGALLTSFSVDAHSIDGLLGEIIVYDRLLTPEERATVRAYQNQKWGIL